MLQSLVHRLRAGARGVAERVAAAARAGTRPSAGPVIGDLLRDVARSRSELIAENMLLRQVREFSSGETQRRGHITKAGNARMRSLLVEAAWSLQRSRQADAQPLREWAGRIVQRRGKRVAAVALARKLAGILFAIWRDGTTFGAFTPNAQQHAA